MKDEVMCLHGFNRNMSRAAAFCNVAVQLRKKKVVYSQNKTKAKAYCNGTDYSSLQADSKGKFAPWPKSWRPPGADRLSSR